MPLTSEELAPINDLLAREKVSIEGGLTPDNALSVLADVVVQATNQRETAVLALSRAEEELESTKAQVLSLSRDSQTSAPDPVMLSLFNRSLKTQREQAIQSGGVTEAVAKAIDDLFTANGQPTALALSRCADGNPDPIVSRLYDVLAKNGGGLAHGNPMARDVFAASRSVPQSTGRDANRQQDDDGPVSPERRKELEQMAGLSI